MFSLFPNPLSNESQPIPISAVDMPHLGFFTKLIGPGFTCSYIFDAACRKGGRWHEGSGTFAEGAKMASTLDSLLKDVNVNAVFSTPYKRTKMTANGVAIRNALTIRDYDPFKVKSLLTQIDQERLENIVVIGHGNTVPEFINTLVSGASLEVMEESDYGKLFVIHYYKNQPQRNNYFVLNIN